MASEIIAVEAQTANAGTIAADYRHLPGGTQTGTPSPLPGPSSASPADPHPVNIPAGTQVEKPGLEQERTTALPRSAKSTKITPTGVSTGRSHTRNDTQRRA